MTVIRATVSMRQLMMPQRSSNHTENSVISWPIRLALPVPAIEIVGQDREQGAEEKFEHGSAPVMAGGGRRLVRLGVALARR